MDFTQGTQMLHYIHYVFYNHIFLPTKNSSSRPIEFSLYIYISESTFILLIM